MELLARLDAARERWNVLRHPFYVRWERGDLTCTELGAYAREYREAVVALAQTAALADADHAAEEAEHVALWDEFADALDADLDTAPNPETVECARSWTACRTPLEALAVLYAIESSQPAISRTKLAGLEEHYGFAPDSPGTAYFRVHAERDLEHAAAAGALLERRATPEETERLVAVAEGALEGNWTLLDGVNSRS